MSYLVYIKQAVANLFKPPVTSEYPLAPKTFCKGVRGRVVNDVSQCILCGMCERSCPSGALTVDRKTGEWKINPFACIQCGACVEACPKKCLSMDPHYAMPGLEKTEIILTAVKKEGVSEVKKTVAAQNAAMLAMDDRSHIVNNVMKCIFCGMCERNCPAGAITVDRRNRTWTIDRNKCITCGACALDCPAKCLSLEETWGEGENKTAVTTYQGKVLTRRPRVRPVPPAQKAETACAPQPKPAPALKEDVPQSENPHHVKNDIEKCLFCGRCEHSCPMQAITIDRKTRQWTIDREKCVACGVCAENCPAKCLTMKEEWEEGEDQALVLTLTGKAPVRSARPRPPVKKDEPHA